MEFQSAAHKISYAFLVKPKVAVLSDVTWGFFDVDLAKTIRNCNIQFHKGQLISKGLFGILNSSKKRTKKFDLTITIPQVELFSFVFLEELKTPKRHSKIN